jgi:ABC-2 type transport system permease protein
LNTKYIISHAWLMGANGIKVQYPYIISNLFFPLSLLFIVGIFSEGTFLSFALVGGLISIAATNGIGVAGEITSFKLDNGYQDLIVTTRTSAMEYMLGEILANLVWSVPSIILFVILELAYHILTPFALVMSVLAGTLVLLSTSSLAFMLSSFVKYMRNIWAVQSILAVLITVIPPTFYPYTYIPSSLLNVMAILPTTAAAVVVQGAFGLAPMQWPMLFVLMIETVVYFFLAKHFTKWRES